MRGGGGEEERRNIPNSYRDREREEEASERSPTSIAYVKMRVVCGLRMRSCKKTAEKNTKRKQLPSGSKASFVTRAPPPPRSALLLSDSKCPLTPPV